MYTFRFHIKRQPEVMRQMPSQTGAFVYQALCGSWVDPSGLVRRLDPKLGSSCPRCLKKVAA